MTRCAVYDLLVDETVVYVGSTVNPKQRCFEHRCREEFKAARLRIYAWYGSVLRAQISESDRIAALRPHYNIACNPDVLVSRHNERKAAIIKEWERDLGSGVPAKDANRKCECRLKHLARRKGATVAEVADLCGVSKQTVRNHYDQRERARLAKLGPTKAQREKYN